MPAPRWPGCGARGIVTLPGWVTRRWWRARSPRRTRARWLTGSAAEFADAVFALEPGAWAGPVASAYGQHLVLVTEHAAARLPELAEVSGRVAADLDAERRAGAVDAIYARLRRGYEVTDRGRPRHEDMTHPNTAAVSAQA